MIAKKHTMLLSIVFLISAAAIHAEKPINTEKKDSSLEKISPSEWQKMIKNFDLNSPNMKATRAAVETVGGVALCLIPQSMIIRMIGLATAGFGVVDINNNEETQVILYKAANTAIEKGTAAAHKAQEKLRDLTKHISEKAKEDKK